MAQHDARSVDEIRRETEQARAALLDTAGQLRNSLVATSQDIRERIKPASIKQEVTGYVRSRAGELLNDAAEAARRNPLQAAAVFGSLAYPAARFVRAIPFPLWLVGAGLYLARSETVAQGTAAIGEKLGDAGVKAMAVAKDALGGTSEQLQQAGDQAGSIMQSASQGAGDLASSAGASLRAASDNVAGTAARISASASQAAAGAAEKLASFSQDTVRSVKSSLGEAGRAAGEAASNVKDQAASSFSRAADENPLLVAGIGLFIGGLIASALPATEIEGSLMGAASKSARRRAQSAADRGVSAVSGAAREGMRRAAQQADAEGLDAEGLSEASRDIGRRLRRVAEAAVTTAFEPPDSSEQEHADGGRDNG